MIIFHFHTRLAACPRQYTRGRIIFFVAPDNLTGLVVCIVVAFKGSHCNPTPPPLAVHNHDRPNPPPTHTYKYVFVKIRGPLTYSISNIVWGFFFSSSSSGSFPSQESLTFISRFVFHFFTRHFARLFIIEIHLFSCACTIIIAVHQMYILYKSTVFINKYLKLNA